MEIVKEYYPDDTQFDPKDPHYDARNHQKKKTDKTWDAKENGWIMVDVKFVRIRQLNIFAFINICLILLWG